MTPSTQSTQTPPQPLPHNPSRAQRVRARRRVTALTIAVVALIAVAVAVAIWHAAAPDTGSPRHPNLPPAGELVLSHAVDLGDGLDAVVPAATSGAVARTALPAGHHLTSVDVADEQTSSGLTFALTVPSDLLPAGVHYGQQVAVAGVSAQPYIATLRAVRPAPGGAVAATLVAHDTALAVVADTVAHPAAVRLIGLGQ